MTTIDAAAEHIVEDFRERGFAHVPGLLTTDEVARFRAAAEEALATQSHTDEEFGTRIVATTDAWEHHPVLRELALHPRIGALAEHLAGMPLRVWGGEVLRKEPGHSAPTGWHGDLTFALLNSRLIFNAWIALVDVPAERGCLTFLPGSHRRGGPESDRAGRAHRRPGQLPVHPLARAALEPTGHDAAAGWRRHVPSGPYRALCRCQHVHGRSTVLFGHVHRRRRHRPAAARPRPARSEPWPTAAGPPLPPNTPARRHPVSSAQRTHRERLVAAPASTPMTIAELAAQTGVPVNACAATTIGVSQQLVSSC